MSLEWYGDRWMKRQRARLARNLARAAIHMVNETKRTLNETRYPPASVPGASPAIRTGLLKNSIAWRLDETELVAYVGTTVVYGKMLELGTSTMQPRPFLVPTFERESGNIAKIIRGEK